MSGTTPRKKAAKKAAPRKAATAAPTQVTAASAWKKDPEQSVGHILTLPSGNVAALRRTLNLPELLAAGKIPNPLAGLVNKMIAEKRPAIAPDPDKDQEAIVQMVQLIQGQLPLIFVEPRVEREPSTWDTDKNGPWKPSEGALSIDQISPEDAMFAFAFAQGGPAEVARFREQSQQIVADLAHEQGVEGEAKQPAGTD